MENPRMLLAKFLDDRIGSAPDSWAASPDKREAGSLTEFVERLASELGRGDFRNVRALAWHVRAGRKAIPPRSMEAWRKALRLRTQAEIEEFNSLVDGARAYGKADGHRHLERQDAQMASLRDQVSTLVRELEDAEKLQGENRAALEADARIIGELRAENIALKKRLEGK